MTEREQRAFQRATVQGYLVESWGMSFEVGETWHLHCQELGWPCVTILAQSDGLVSVVCDLDGIWMSYQAQGVALPVLPTLTPSKKTKAQLAHLIRSRAQESYHGPLYTALYGVQAAQSVQVAQALLALWNEAKVFVDQPGLWQSDIPASA